MTIQLNDLIVIFECFVLFLLLQAEELLREREKRERERASAIGSQDSSGLHGSAYSPSRSSYKTPVSTPKMSKELATALVARSDTSTQEEMLVKYQQDQMDMITALTQLYGQSAYSMAYASTLQAMGAGMYESYNPYAAMAGVGQMSSPVAQSLLQNAALAASAGAYPYAGYGLTAEAQSALCQSLLADKTAADSAKITSPTSYSRTSAFQSPSSTARHKTSPKSEARPHADHIDSQAKYRAYPTSVRSSPQSVRHEAGITPTATKHSPETLKSTSHLPKANVSSSHKTSAALSHQSGVYGASSVKSTSSSHLKSTNSQTKKEIEKVLQGAIKYGDAMLEQLKSTSEHFSVPKVTSSYAHPIIRSPPRSLLSTGSIPTSVPASAPKASPSSHTASGLVTKAHKYSGSTASPARQSNHTVSPARQSSHMVSPARQSSHTVSPARQSSHTVSPARQSSHTVNPARQSSHTVSPARQSSHMVSPARQSSHTVSPARYSSNTASPSRHSPGGSTSTSQYSPGGSGYSASSSSPSISLSTTASPGRSISITNSPSKYSTSTVSPSRYPPQFSHVRYSKTSETPAYSISSESQDIVIISSSQESDED